MSIVIPDLDSLIISFLELPSCVALMKINNHYYDKIKRMQLIIEWNKIIYERCSLNSLFIIVCDQGFITYAKSLIDRYKINIHFNEEAAFIWSCQKGHLEIAQWLVDLGEKCGYGHIDICTCNYLAFNLSFYCYQPIICKWLIDLGEKHGYSKIDIHAAFNNHHTILNFDYKNGHNDLLKWLIDLGENHGYGKLNSELIKKIEFQH